MRIMVIGGGGREHALAWKISQSPRVAKVYACPGNDGMKAAGVECVDLNHIDAICEFARRERIDLTVVGPERLLCDGIVDVFNAAGLKIFGPGKHAAQLEGSKWFAKQFMRTHGIPTGAADRFTDPDLALAALRAASYPLVVKADGLAAGKGVVVASTREQAENAIHDCFNGAFGSAGQTVIIEEFIAGEEVSIMALVDQHTIIPLASAQDHKQLLDGDRGPNTGGMGAYSPSRSLPQFNPDEIMEQVLRPFLRGCQKERLNYHGIIYAGLMISESGPKVLEFNVRFGDPETQAILMRLESDLVSVLLGCVEDRLANFELAWSKDQSVCIVLTSPGYPGEYRKGLPITGIAAAEEEGAMVFHAGTKLQDESWITNGGRVLGITTRGKTIGDACQKAYRATARIHWDGIHYRRDIGSKAVK